MTGRGELVFDLDDDENEEDQPNEQQANGNQPTSSTDQINNYYEPGSDDPSGNDESYDPSVVRRQKSKRKTPKRRTKELKNQSISSEETLPDQPSTSRTISVLGKRSAKYARTSNSESYSKKQKLSLPPKSKFFNKNASSDKDNEASKLPNLDLSYYNLKDNAFIEKQPKFKFDKNSLIGQVVHKYSNSMTSAEIRLSVRRMDNDELLSSIVKDMDDLLNENEQLHKTIEALTQRNTEFEQTIADLRGEFASNSSEHPNTTESPRKLQTLMKEMNCKIVVNQSTPNIIEESNQQNGNSPMQCETSEEPAEHQIQQEVVVENTNESFDSLREVSPIDTSNTSNAPG